MNTSYQLDLKKNIEYYEHGIDDNLSLTEAGQNILLTQKTWIEQLQQKIHNHSIQNKIPGNMLGLIFFEI